MPSDRGGGLHPVTLGKELSRSQWTDPSELGIEIVLTVAEATGRDHTEFPRLQTVVDPDAMESLFDTDNPSLQMTFDYAGCRVFVDGTGQIQVFGESPNSRY